ncbi:MAG: DnaA N-terminal domain-containing protein [bacterium]
MNISTTLRNGTSYFQIVERYSVILRKISFLHESVIEEFKPELEPLINKIDTMIVELENTDSRTEKLFDLRRMLFQLEDIVDFKSIRRYNELLDAKRPLARAEVITRKETVQAQEVTKQDIANDVVSTPKDVWENVTGYLKSQLNVHTYNVWVKPVEFHSCDEKKIKVAVQNQFYKNWLEDHCSRLIKKHLDDIGMDYEVTFIVG